MRVTTIHFASSIGEKKEERRKTIVTTAAKYNGLPITVGGRRAPAINTRRSAADSVKPAQTTCLLSANAM